LKTAIFPGLSFSGFLQKLLTAHHDPVDPPAGEQGVTRVLISSGSMCYPMEEGFPSRQHISSATRLFGHSPKKRNSRAEAVAPFSIIKKIKGDSP
jgi:hypothetical protein